jgi:hypothetical protein
MSWFLLAVAGIGAVEVLLRLPLMRTVARFRSTLAKVSAVIRSEKISDHWKEKVVPTYALRLLRMTALTAACLLRVIAPFVFLFAVAEAVAIPFYEFAVSPTSLLFTSILALGYSTLRFASARS